MELNSTTSVPLQAEDTAERKVNSLSTQVGGNHYKTMEIQPVEYILKNKLGWCEGNIVKYISRHRQKGERKDIEKVIHYAQMILDTEYPNDRPT